MGRTTAYDRETALANARDLFWRQGYEAAAVPDLEAATGIKRSSLYHAFGSKKALFKCAIDSYLTNKVRPLLADMTATPATPTALTSYFDKLAANISSTETIQGCLLIASAGAPIGQDPTVAAQIESYYSELQAAFTAGLQALAPNLTKEAVATHAQTLLAFNITALTLARINTQLAHANIHAAHELLADITKKSAATMQ